MMQNFVLKYLVCTPVLKGWPQISSSSTWELEMQILRPHLFLNLRGRSRGGAQQFLL